MSLIGKCYSCDRKVWSDDGPQLYMVGGECNHCGGEELCSYCEKETVYREYEDKCNNCGRSGFTDGDGISICDDCMAVSSCGHCGADIGFCCFDNDAAVKAEENKCCNQDLCKDCLKDHKMKKDHLLACGHLICNLVEEEGIECLTCHKQDEAILEEKNRSLDIMLLEDQLQQHGRVKGKLGKELLEAALNKLMKSGNDDDDGKESGSKKRRKVSE